MTEMHVDRRRIYVVGFSNGALLAYRWGAARSQSVAGIVAVAGAIGGKASFLLPEVRIAIPKFLEREARSARARKRFRGAGIRPKTPC